MLQSLFNRALQFSGTTQSQTYNQCEAKPENEKTLTRKERKEVEHKQFDKEQSEFIDENYKRLQSYFKDQEKYSSERSEHRRKMKDLYENEKILAKYKHNLQKRLQQNDRSTVTLACTGYGSSMMRIQTDDPIVKKYSQKVTRYVQWEMLIHQHYPIVFGLIIYGITRRLKAYRPSDKLYFAVPYTAFTWATYAHHSKEAFQEGYPAHPLIIQHRTDVINKTCYVYPQIIKNEIEYLQLKLKQNREETDEAFKFEKEFKTGYVRSEYKKALDEQNKKNKTVIDEQELSKGKRFKFVVEDGELNLQCIDPFEEIFEIKKEAVDKLSITEILDPQLFDSHKDIINALFEIYFDLSNQYLKENYYDKITVNGKVENTSLASKADQKLRMKYGLDQKYEHLQIKS